MKKLIIVLFAFIGLQSLSLFSSEQRPLLTDFGNEPAIHSATRFLNLRVMDSLLKNGEDINSRNSRGETLLYILVNQIVDEIKEDNSQIIKFVLDKGADINAKIGQNQWTALHYAVASFNVKHVETLLSYQNIDLNITNRNGETPLMLANKYSKYKYIIFPINEIIELLLERQNQEYEEYQGSDEEYYSDERDETERYQDLNQNNTFYGQSQIESKQHNNCPSPSFMTKETKDLYKKMLLLTESNKIQELANKNQITEDLTERKEQEELESSVQTSETELKTDKVKLSKHKLEKIKKTELKTKAMIATRKKNNTKRQLKADSINSQSPTNSGQDFNEQQEQNSNAIAEDYVIIDTNGNHESQEQYQSNSENKQDLRLHLAISNKKEFEDFESLITFETLNIADKEGNFPLHLAVMSENIKACQRIIEVIFENILDEDKRNDKINETNIAERTALHYAVLRKNHKIVDYLLYMGADSNLLTEKIKAKLTLIMQENSNANLHESKDQTESQCSAASSSSGFDKDLIRKSVENQMHKFDKNYNNFIKEIENGKYSSVRNTLSDPKKQRYIYITDENNDRALHCAVRSDNQRKDKNFKITKLLLEMELKTIYALNNNYLTPFHLAIELHNVEMCKYFLTKIVMIPQLNIMNYLAHLKTFCEQEISKFSKDKNLSEILKLLNIELKRIQQTQINLNPYLKYDKVQLSEKLFNYVKFYIKSLKSPSLEEQLPIDDIRNNIILMIRAGADLTKSANSHDISYLHHFAALGDYEIVKLLISHGANLEAKDKLGNIPLHCAALKINLNVIPLLLTPKTKDVKNYSGDTPLNVLIMFNGNKEAIELLIRLGVDTQIKNNYLLTPFLCSIIMEKSEISNLLFSHTLNNVGRNCEDIIQDIDDVITNDTENNFRKLSEFKQHLLKKKADIVEKKLAQALIQQ